MGIQHPDHPGHEGYIVGFVTREGVQRDSGIYRELGYPEKEERVVEMVAAACDCGWRSPRWRPSARTTYSPYSINDSEADHERMYQLWDRHLQLDVVGPSHPVARELAAEVGSR
jgi:hypothetical protein